MVLIQARQECRSKSDGAGGSRSKLNSLDFIVTPARDLDAYAFKSNCVGCVGEGDGDHAKSPVILTLQRSVVGQDRKYLAIDAGLNFIWIYRLPDCGWGPDVTPVCGGVTSKRLGRKNGTDQKGR